MNVLQLKTTEVDGVTVMSSVDLAELCLGDVKNAHSHFMEKAKKVIGIGLPNFRDSYLSKQNKELTCLMLPEREACLMAMSYSYELQAKVYDAWQALKVEPKQRTSLEIFESMTSEQMALTVSIQKDKEALMVENKIIAKVSEKKSFQNYTPTKLLGFIHKEGLIKGVNILSASDINTALTHCGYQTHNVVRHDVTKVHSYLLTEKGGDFGVNSISGRSSFNKWVYLVIKQEDFIDTLVDMISGEFY